MQSGNVSVTQPKLLIPFGAVVALVFGVFVTSSHLPTLPEATRQQMMVGGSLLTGVFAAIACARLGWSVTLKFLFPAVFIAVIFSAHNMRYPPLTDYAATKRVFFLPIFITCYCLVPLSVHVFDTNLKQVIRVLIVVSIIFSFLAFVAPTGENLRRSGIELNPLMHAKLLFFPALFAIASLGIRRIDPFLIVLLAFTVFACLKTGSRSPILVIVIIVFLDIFLSRSVYNFLRIVFLTAALVSVGYFLIGFLPSDVVARYSLVEFLDHSAEGDRLFLIQFVTQLILLHPEGIGMGNMSAHFWINAPHNVILEAILDFGVIVSLPYIFLILAATQQSITLLKNGDLPKRFLSCWYLFFLGLSLTGGEMSFPSLLFYVPMGLILLNYLSPKKSKQLENSHA